MAGISPPLNETNFKVYFSGRLYDFLRSESRRGVIIAVTQ
jgi:hypothetical protein